MSVPVDGGADDAEALRAAFRPWLDAHFTPEVRAAVGQHGTDEGWAAQRAWNATLVDAGWGAIAWPVEFGGRAAGIGEQVAYHEEMSRAGAPGPVNAIGVANIAPAIMAVGTAEQQARSPAADAPRRRDLEPGHVGARAPGSDLASLRCAAERDGDHFVVTGQKTWNSNGDRADWCQLYVRTDRPTAPKHEGITCLLVDMTHARDRGAPDPAMAGDSGFAEVFFDEVRVPVSAVLGEVGEGWAVATRTLSNERAGVAPLYLSLRRKLDRLLDVAPAGVVDPLSSAGPARAGPALHGRRDPGAARPADAGRGARPAAHPVRRGAW